MMKKSSDRIKQVETTKERYGPNHYKEIGSKGGKLSGTRFDSTTAKKAVEARWKKYREEKAKNKGETDEKEK